MQAVIRCDAGATVGGGHAVRCGALGAALRQAGFDVVFAVSDDTVASLPELPVEFPGALTGMTAGEDDRAHMVARWPSGVDLMVVDHYGLGEPFERSLAGWARKVLVIDDAPSRPHACTHLVDATFNRRAVEYRDRVDAGTALLCGSDYAMLREAFRTRRPAALARKPAGVRRVLVSMGLNDEANATEAVLKGLSGVEWLRRVDCVLGAGAPHLDAVRAAVAAGGSGWRLHTGVDGEAMAGLTAGADMVIGASGSASYERCCLGRPALLVVTADNQRPNAAALQQAGAASLVGELSHETPFRVGEAVRALAEDGARLRAMHLAAAAICDGNGADRVARAVLSA